MAFNFTILFILLSILTICNSSQFIVTELNERIDLIANIYNLSRIIYDRFETNILKTTFQDKSLSFNTNTYKDFLYDLSFKSDYAASNTNNNDDYYTVGTNDKTGFSDSCNNKFCTMIKYLVSCKAIKLGVSKYCARYLLGYVYGCDNMFGKDQITNAPSTCLDEVGYVAKTLINETAFGMLLGNYLGKDFKSNSCGRRCYQNYQYASHDFYLNCKPQLINNSTTKTPVITGLSFYQEFRNQACSHNSTNKDTKKDVNCYETITNLGKTADPNGPNIFDFTCNYTSDSITNYKILQGTCQKLSEYGCCATTGITLTHQNQLSVLQSAISAAKSSSTTSSSDFVIFPPCLMRFLQSSACPGVELLNYCRNGSIATTTAMTGSIFIPNNDPPEGKAPPFPNVYSKNITVSLQAAITNALVNASAIFRGPPYYLNPDYPFQIQIIDYVYYDENNDPLVSPSIGGTYTPSQEDYKQAYYGNFTYQLVTQDLTEENAAFLYSYLEDPTFKANIAHTYGVIDETNTRVAAGSSPVNHLPNPLEISSSGQYSYYNISSSLSMYLLFFNMIILTGLLYY